MGLAQTGTGKTAAFGLPLVHRLLEDNKKPEPKAVRALILAPTRELVNQISDNMRQYVKKTPIWVRTVIGGASINSQARALSAGCDILVATPGRLLDLAERKALHLDTVNYLVLDEADQMLDLGFIHSLRKIAKLLGKPRQTLLFSATMPKQVEDLSKAFLEEPVRVEVSPPGKAADKIEQTIHHTNAGNKTNLLKDCLIKHDGELTLVFARTKHGAEKLMKHLVESGFKADSIHGNKSQGQRDRAIRAFKKHEIDILVATDVAARGIDIPGVSYVYNFNLPEVPENYVHRIGRTARAGTEGKAVAFCAPDEMKYLKQIEKLMSISIAVESGEEPAKFSAGKPASRTRGRNRKPARANHSENRTQEASRPKRKKPDGTHNKYDSGQVAQAKHKTSDETASSSKKPKKFRNKQVSVSEYDASEKRRNKNKRSEFGNSDANGRTNSRTNAKTNTSANGKASTRSANQNRFKAGKGKGAGSDQKRNANRKKSFSPAL